jgi:hypothetical protein
MTAPFLPTITPAPYSVTAQYAVYPLYAGAYVAGRRGRGHSKAPKGSTLTHACELDADGFPRKVLCGRVDVENICHDVGTDNHKVPTCRSCAVRLARARRAVRP